MKSRNVTLSLPEDLLRQLKVISAKQGTSLSAMLTGALRQIVDENDRYAEAQHGMLKELRKGYNLGTHGKLSWTREDVHLR